MSAATNNDAAVVRGDRQGGNEEFPANPPGLADAQPDDDKSSLESGQVSPAAQDEREETNNNNAVAPF